MGAPLAKYLVTRWGTQNVTDSNTNSTAPSRCRASSSSEGWWRYAGACGARAAGSKSQPYRKAAGSVPPIYTKGATYAYPRGGVLVQAQGPWDTFPTERRRHGGGGVGPTYLHKRGHFCISARRCFGAGAWTVRHVPCREAAARWRQGRSHLFTQKVPVLHIIAAGFWCRRKDRGPRSLPRGGTVVGGNVRFFERSG